MLRPTFLRTGEHYSWEFFRADFIAGITVAIIQIPQSMALALIAGLPAVYGLYASLPGFIASLWGSSRNLSTGPVAIVSFLTFTSLVPLAEPGSAKFIALASALALLVGLMYIVLGTLRLGFLVQFVPHSVIVGFSSAAALIIVVTQIPTLLGIEIVQHDIFLQNILEIVSSAPQLSLATLLLGILAIGLLYGARSLPRVFPTTLLLLAAGIGVSDFFDLELYGIALVHDIPSALPSFSPPLLGIAEFFSLLPKAAIIATVGFVEAHAIAKSIARQTREHLDTNQELVGQGLANIVAGFFRGYPMSGSFTRTAVNVDAGAKTGIAALVTALVTMLVLLFFTPLFYHLPRAFLAAIVVISALSLINVRQLREMYRTSRTDGFVAWLTFAIALLLKPDDAILIGIIVALMLFVRQTISGARVVEIGIDRELNILRGELGEKSVDTFPGVCIARITMSMYYANAAHITAGIDEEIAHHVMREKAPLQTLVLDVSPINFIDITGIEVLQEYFENLQARGISVHMIYLRRALKASLERVPHFPPFKVHRNIADLRSSVLLTPSQNKV